MFRRSLARQVRLCRPARVSALPALSPLSRAALHNSPINHGAVASLSSLKSVLASRAYSSAAVADAQAPAPAPAAPAAPSTKFADLRSLGVHESVVRAITEGMGYENMTDVQSMTLGPALAGKDIVAQAKTGTGKTLAFLVPIIQNVINDEPRLGFREPGKYVRARADDIRSIIISPTRELAEQIAQEAEKLCRFTSVRVQRAVGGSNKSSMLRQTRRDGCHILVATPGRLLDLLSDEYSGIDAPNLTSLVLDEADRMLEVGFEKELHDIIRLLPDRSKKSRQTLLYSATIPQNVVQLARSYVNPNNFEFVQTVKADDVLTHHKVPQHIVPIKGYENYFPTLLELVERAMNGEHGPEPFKAIVFFQTTAMVELATDILHSAARAKRGSLPRILNIHSKKTQQQRTTAAETFKQERSAILLSSDVTARGMDFPNVTHVIQMGVPPSREQYIHRLGRTGRAQKSGQGWLIVSEKDVPAARDTLPGLPIKRHQGLESAQADLASGDQADLPKHVELVSEVLKQIDGSKFTFAYLSHFGGVDRREAARMVEQLNNWSRYGFGWDEPPAIPAGVVQKRGLGGIPGINIASTRRRDSYGGDRDRDRDHAPSGFERRDRYQDEDPFSRIAPRSGDRGQSRGRPRSGGWEQSGGRPRRSSFNGRGSREYSRPESSF
ncbi:hypothetical protein NKR23_g8230 [Pleurostoma richardsiae]|uniref:ATP-dependent RNA helicase n=1 Tax=Pleurostoma richardsiae TaxID=41990 RepID=A0AA38VLG6_9PEZI|nr:hypothetical protein NKR23_g8230 [Pleurostoma richardsiae]